MKTNHKTKNREITLLFMGVLLLVFSGCSPEPIISTDEMADELIIVNSTTRASGSSANGHGTMNIEDTPNTGEGFRHFSFHAKEKHNGIVNGSAVLTYQGGQLNLKLDIDCLTIIGNRAIMTGVITRWSTFPEGVGNFCYIEVVDNGEGANAAPDQISLVFNGTNPAVYSCTNDFDVFKYDVNKGNIQVKL